MTGGRVSLTKSIRGRTGSHRSAKRVEPACFTSHASPSFRPITRTTGTYEKEGDVIASSPPHPNLDWLRKTAKQRLSELREADPLAKLADAQRAVAREYGFPSWRKLKAHIEAALSLPAPSQQSTADAAADEIVKGFFGLVGAGKIDDVRAVLDASPKMVNAVGPHPFWGGRPQALHVAIEGGRRDLFDLLLERGANVNGSNDTTIHWSPLMLAMNRDAPACATSCSDAARASGCSKR